MCEFSHRCIREAAARGRKRSPAEADNAQSGLTGRSTIGVDPPSSSTNWRRPPKFLRASLESGPEDKKNARSVKSGRKIARSKLYVRFLAGGNLKLRILAAKTRIFRDRTAAQARARSPAAVLSIAAILFPTQQRAQDQSDSEGQPNRFIRVLSNGAVRALHRHAR